MGSKTQQNETTEAKKPPTNQYRYFCDACTGIAFLSVAKKNPGFSVCTNCGKPLGAIKEENFIAL